MYTHVYCACMLLDVQTFLASRLHFRSSRCTVRGLIREEKKERIAKEKAKEKVTEEKSQERKAGEWGRMVSDDKAFHLLLTNEWIVSCHSGSPEEEKKQTVKMLQFLLSLEKRKRESEEEDIDSPRPCKKSESKKPSERRKRRKEKRRSTFLVAHYSKLTIDLSPSAGCTYTSP